MKPLLLSVANAWRQYIGETWEELCRASVPRLTLADTTFGPAARWWGIGSDGQRLELDIIAEAADDSGRVLVGEAKTKLSERETERALAEVRSKAERCP